MRKTTKGKGFAGSVLITIVTAVFMLLATGALLAGYFGDSPEPFATGLILLVAALYLAVAAGVTAALWQRWREIQRGEEDEAKKY